MPAGVPVRLRPSAPFLRTLMANVAMKDYAVSPGEVLRYELELRDMSQAELARRAGLSEQRVMIILNGDDGVIITPETALKLEHALGMPVEYWRNLEAHCRETRAPGRNAGPSTPQGRDETQKSAVKWRAAGA